MKISSSIFYQNTINELLKAYINFETIGRLAANLKIARGLYQGMNYYSSFSLSLTYSNVMAKKMIIKRKFMIFLNKVMTETFQYHLGVLSQTELRQKWNPSK